MEYVLSGSKPANTWFPVLLAVVIWELAGNPSPVRTKSKVPFPPTVFLTKVILASFSLVNVQVTVSPGDISIALTRLPSEQVVLSNCQPETPPSDT